MSLSSLLLNLIVELRRILELVLFQVSETLLRRWACQRYLRMRSHAYSLKLQSLGIALREKFTLFNHLVAFCGILLIKTLRN